MNDKNNTGVNDLLLKLLQRLALHAKLEGVETITFRKRNLLLEKLKEADPKAFQVIHDVIEVQLRVDRIVADKEKEQKSFAVWSAELEKAKAKKTEDSSLLIQFFKDRKISLEGLNLEVLGI